MSITFTMIKPDATKKAQTGAIIDRILQAKFTIKAMSLNGHGLLQNKQVNSMLFIKVVLFIQS